MSERNANPMQAGAFLRDQECPARVHTQISFSFGERMDPGAVRQAWDVLRTSLPILRSRFHPGSGKEVVIESLADGTPAVWAEHDWREVSPQEIPEKWEALREADSSAPFGEDSSPRVAQIFLPGGGTHHLLTLPTYLLDETSVSQLIVRWLVALSQPSLPPAGEAPAPAPSLKVWTEILKPAASPLRLHPRPPSLALHSATLGLGRDETRRFMDACESKGLSPQAVTHSLWALLLRRLGATGNVTLGLFDLRPSPDEIGYFENWLPVPHCWDHREWLRDAQQRHEAIRANGWLSPASALASSASAIGQIESGFLWRGPGINDLVHTALPRWINFDARTHIARPEMLLLEARPGPQLTLQIHGPIGGEACGQNLLRHLLGWMQSLGSLENKSAVQIPLLLPQDLKTLKEWSRGGELPEHPPTALAAFRDAVSKGPDNVAVRDGDYELTYRELDTLSDRLAAHMAKVSLTGGWHVALFLSPSSWVAIALLGSWKAGNSCLALDPAASPEWIESMLSSHDAGVVVCDAASAPLLDATSRRRIVIDQDWDTLETADIPEIHVAPDSPAAILPGHVDGAPPQFRALTQELLVAAATEGARLLDFGPGDSFLAHAAAGGGAFWDEWLLPILAGGTVRVMGADQLDPATCEVTHLRLTAPEWANQAARWARGEGRVETPLRAVAVECGSPCRLALDIWNHCTGRRVRTVTFHSPAGLCGLGLAGEAMSAGTVLPAGKPTAGVEASICDEDGLDVLPGFAGSLWMKFPGWKKISKTRARKGLPINLRAWRNEAGQFFVEGSDRRLPDFSLAASRLRGLPTVIDSLVGEQNWVVSPEEVEGALVLGEWPINRSGWIDEPALPRPEPPRSQQVPMAATPRQQAPPAPWKPVSLLQSKGGLRPMVLVPPAAGSPESYRDFVLALGETRRILGLTARGIAHPDACHTTIESAAAAWIAALVEEDPTLTFDLCGFGYGGIVALEMARQLDAAKRPVPGIILLGTPTPHSDKPTGWLSSVKNVFKRQAQDDRMEPFPANGEPARTHHAAWLRYRFAPSNLFARIVIPSDFPQDAPLAWLALLPEAHIEPVKCTWAEMLSFPAVKRLASILSDT